MKKNDTILLKKLITKLIIGISLGIILYIFLEYILKGIAIRLNLPSDFFLPPLIAGLIFSILIIVFLFLKEYRLIKRGEYRKPFALSLEKGLERKLMIFAGGEVLIAVIQLYLLYNRNWIGLMISLIPQALLITFWRKKYRKRENQ